MSNVLLGLDSAAVELPPRYIFDTSRGWTTIRTFKGTPAQVAALEANYAASGWNTDVTGGAVWTLTATTADDDRSPGIGEEPIDLWELSANVVEKDILSSNCAVVKAFTTAITTYLRDVLDGKVDISGKTCVSEATTPAAIYGNANAIQVFLCIAHGLKSERVSAPTLRHTRTAARDYEFASATTGVNELYSKTALGLAETIPLGIFNNMTAPPAVNPFTRTDGVIVFAGWKKQFPHIQASASGKSQIVTEWEYNEWATIINPTYHA